MIRARPSRSSLLALAAIVGLCASFGQRPSDPAAADPLLTRGAQRALAERARAAQDELDALDAALQPALAEGRRGSARVVAGSEPPGPPLEAAAAALEAASGEATSLAAALEAVAGSTAMPPGVEVEAPVAAAELTSIAAQLRAASGPGEEFAAMRRRAADEIRLLDEALAALTAGDPATAVARAREARQLHDVLTGWESGLPTMPIWLETTAELLGAVEALAAATLAGDATAAAAAAARFDAVVADAREADVALDLAVSEGGAAVAAAPLQRLASVLARASATRQSLASILHRTGAPAR